MSTAALDYTRQRDWFDPSRSAARVTVVGCGGIGSFAAFALAKLGVQEMNLVDFDTVDEHNIPNQMFSLEQQGQDKVAAIAENLLAFSGIEPNVFPVMLGDEGWPLSDVVISALDSMAARADLWTQVKRQLSVRLFLDARLGGENVVLYALNPSLPSDIEGYEATLHSDYEGLELPCTARSIIDVGFAVGSLITRAVRRHYAGEALDKVTYLDQRNLDFYKGGWA